MFRLCSQEPEGRGKSFAEKCYHTFQDRQNKVESFVQEEKEMKERKDEAYRSLLYTPRVPRYQESTSTRIGIDPRPKDSDVELAVGTFGTSGITIQKKVTLTNDYPYDDEETASTFSWGEGKGMCHLPRHSSCITLFTRSLWMGLIFLGIVILGLMIALGIMSRRQSEEETSYPPFEEPEDGSVFQLQTLTSPTAVP